MTMDVTASSESSETSSTDENKCTICLVKISETDEKLATACMHVFHEHCLTQWLRKKNECPLCRFENPCPNLGIQQITQEVANQSSLVRMEAGAASLRLATRTRAADMDWNARARGSRGGGVVDICGYVGLLAGIVGTINLLPSGMKELRDGSDDPVAYVKIVAGCVSVAVFIASVASVVINLRRRHAH